MGEPALEKLKHFGQKVVTDPDMMPHDITGDGKDETFCNQAVHRIAFALIGYESFEGITANMIYDHMDRLWDKIMPDEAHRLAEEGYLVIAARKAKPHGHCAVVAPGPMVYSGKWKIEVPLVYNVGGYNKKGESLNGIIGVNHAFGDPPEFFKHPKHG